MGRKSEERYIYEGGLLQLRGPSPTRSTHREPSPTRSTHSEANISSSSEAPKKSKLRRGLSKLLPGHKKAKTETFDVQPLSPPLSPALAAAPEVALARPSSFHSVDTAPKADSEPPKPSPISKPVKVPPNFDIIPPKPSPIPAKMSANPTAVRYDEAQAQGNRRLSGGVVPGPNSVLHKEPGQLIKGAVDEHGELKDAALLLGIKLDLEAEVHLTARVRGDITIGLY